MDCKIHMEVNKNRFDRLIIDDFGDVHTLHVLAISIASLAEAVSSGVSGGVSYRLRRFRGAERVSAEVCIQLSLIHI